MDWGLQDGERLDLPTPKTVDFCGLVAPGPTLVLSLGTYVGHTAMLPVSCKLCSCTMTSQFKVHWGMEGEMCYCVASDTTLARFTDLLFVLKVYLKHSREHTPTHTHKSTFAIICFVVASYICLFLNCDILVFLLKFNCMFQKWFFKALCLLSVHVGVGVPLNPISLCKLLQA